MKDPRNREIDANRLRSLLERLQSDDLQLGEARELRRELLTLVGAREADCSLV
jgi:hypothetical protein